MAQKEYDYLIWKDGSTYRCQSGATGCNIYSNADAATVFNYAIDLMETADNQTLLIKNATYPISTPISMTAAHRCKISGEGPGTILQTPDTTDENILYVYYCHDVTIENLVFDGNRINNGGDCYNILCTNSDNITIQNCKIINASYYGIMVYESEADTVFDINIKNNYIYNSGFHGIFVTSGADNITISGNRVKDCCGAVHASFNGGIFCNGCYNVLIENNICTGMVNAGYLTAGIVVYHDGATVTGPPIIYPGCVISNNICNLNNGQGILVESVPGVIIDGNFCKNNLCAGIYLEDATYGGLISNNLCITNSPAVVNDWDIQGGIQAGTWTYTPNRCKYINNFCYKNGGNGLALEGSHVSVIGNTCINNMQLIAGPYWNGAISVIGEYNLLTDNICYDDQGTKTQIYGIDLGIVNTGLAHYSMVYNNDVRSNLTGGILLNGSLVGVKVKNNMGHITEGSGTATLLSGNSAIVVTHGLAATPTKVVVTGSEAETMILYVDTIGATYFTIHTPEPVSSNRTIYWYAEV